MDVADTESIPAFAHTAPDGESEWQPLRDHLEGVAALAARFGGAFGAEEWAGRAGLWHDIGKYSLAFQRYLRSAAAPDVHGSDALVKTDHSTAGAQHAVRRYGPLGQLLAYPIAGHHSGLLDAISSSAACLEARLEKVVEPWEPNAPDDLLASEPLHLPPILQQAVDVRDGFAIAFFVRMLFSCLVDADFLDTGAFMAPEREGQRLTWPPDTLERMEVALTAHVDRFGPPSTDVNQRRAEVFQSCVDAATRPPGFFSLTVPTGGGKTLSSLAFALRHARLHEMERIIYVAPFTSIIEQNADVLRTVFEGALGPGIDPVVEHHSNLDPAVETTQSRLASENWDAPLVVTTAVQFYESLFANRPSRCRKLHNVARSVIVLDEAQCLPVDYLQPCLRALEQLCDGYGSSVILCTATQPAVVRNAEFPIGVSLPVEREIVSDPRRLFRQLKRVEVTRAGQLSDEAVADRLTACEQVLCIVNTRGHARDLYRLIAGLSGTYHLSASMCPEHRAATLAEVRSALASGSPCRLVSTQVVEAGVDLDFPVVYRAMAGLDSIAQAAGRCNRHGLRASGDLVVFDSEHTQSEAYFADTAGSARQVLAVHEDPLSLEAVEHYFRLHYWEQSHRWDRHGVMERFVLAPSSPALPFIFDFAAAARDFRLIEDGGASVFVPWGDRGQVLRAQLAASWAGPSRELLRAMQRFTVQVPRHAIDKYGDGAFQVMHGQYRVLAFPERHYASDVGLSLEAGLGDRLIV